MSKNIRLLEGSSTHAILKGMAENLNKNVAGRLPIKNFILNYAQVTYNAFNERNLLIGFTEDEIVEKGLPHNPKRSILQTVEIKTGTGSIHKMKIMDRSLKTFH